jgi:transposase-like protein
MPKGYAAEFRRRALDLVRSGRPVAQVAAELGISAQAIYTGASRIRLIVVSAPA